MHSRPYKRVDPMHTDRASSVSSSGTGTSTGNSENTDHPPSEAGSSEEVDENQHRHYTTSRVQAPRISLVEALAGSPNIAERHAVADVEHAPRLDIDEQLESGHKRGKRRNRQGQKSKEAYNRKRREKKKSERRERAAAARQPKMMLSSGNVELCQKQPFDAVRA